MDKATPTRRKRTQCDYTMGFKLAVVEQVETGWLDFNFMYESYAAKSAEINGTPVVKVQNRGSSFSLGLRYLF